MILGQYLLLITEFWLCNPHKIILHSHDEHYNSNMNNNEYV